MKHIKTMDEVLSMYNELDKILEHYASGDTVSWDISPEYKAGDSVKWEIENDYYLPGDTVLFNIADQQFKKTDKMNLKTYIEDNVETIGEAKQLIKFILDKISNKKIAATILGFALTAMVFNVPNFDFSKIKKDPVLKVKLKPIAHSVENIYKTNVELMVPYKGDFEDYKKKLSEFESSGDWKITNDLGYRGKYQFGDIALKDIGKSHITYKAFRANPYIWPEHEQEKDIKKLTSNNLHYIRSVKKYIGTIYTDVQITKDGRRGSVIATESGMAAAAHLVGSKDTRIFFKSGGSKIPKDGNQIPLTVYLYEFSGFDLSKI